MDEWDIETDMGFSPILSISQTIEYQEYNISTSTGKSLICADTHIVFDENGNEIFVKDCIPNETNIMTRDGVELVENIVATDKYSQMYDVSVDDYNHRFYSNDILSHNSFAFLDSITYGLFGKPFRKINIPQLSNTINNKQCIVEIEFIKGTDVYLVRRGINPKIFEIFKNDTLLNQTSSSLDYQALLEDQVLKMNYKTFTQVVILGSSSFVPFMQLTPNDRRAVIENILDIDIFSTMNVLVKGKLIQLKENIRNLVSKIEVETNKINVQTNFVKSIADKSKDHSTIIDIEIEELNNSITITSSDFIKINEELARLKDQISDKNIVKEKIDKMQHLCIRLKSNVKIMNDSLSLLENNDTCPACNQSIDENFKKKEIEDKLVKKKTIETAVDTLKEKIITQQTRVADINKHIDTMVSLQLLLGKKEVLLENFNKQLISLNAKKQIKLEQDKDINAEQNKLDSYIDEMHRLTAEKEEIHSEMIYNEAVNELLKDGGVKSKIVKYYLPYINKYINKFLTSMNFFAQFNLDENFKEEIKSRNRDTFSYENFSEGEKMRIDLSLLLAWREIARAKNSVNCNLLILDEVFDSSLDSVGTDELMKLINVISDKSNIFIISHKSDQLIDKFQHVVTFEKKHNFSKMLAV